MIEFEEKWKINWIFCIWALWKTQYMWKLPRLLTFWYGLQQILRLFLKKGKNQEIFLNINNLTQDLNFRR